MSPADSEHIKISNTETITPTQSPNSSTEYASAYRIEPIWFWGQQNCSQKKPHTNWRGTKKQEDSKTTIDSSINWKSLQFHHRSLFTRNKPSYFWKQDDYMHKNPCNNQSKTTKTLQNQGQIDLQTERPNNPTTNPSPRKRRQSDSEGNKIADIKIHHHFKRYQRKLRRFKNNP